MSDGELLNIIKEIPFSCEICLRYKKVDPKLRIQFPLVSCFNGTFKKLRTAHYWSCYEITASINSKESFDIKDTGWHIWVLLSVSLLTMKENLTMNTLQIWLRIWTSLLRVKEHKALEVMELMKHTKQFLVRCYENCGMYGLQFGCNKSIVSAKKHIVLHWWFQS